MIYWTMQDIKISLGHKTLLFIVTAYSVAVTLLFFIPTSLLVSTETLENNKIPHIDKLVHAVLFFTLSYLWQWYFYKRKITSLQVVNTKVLFIALMVYGIIVEILQEFLPIPRGGDFFDFFADLVGALLGIVAFNYFKNKIHS